MSLHSGATPASTRGEWRRVVDHLQGRGISNPWKFEFDGSDALGLKGFCGAELTKPAFCAMDRKSLSEPKPQRTPKHSLSMQSSK